MTILRLVPLAVTLGTAITSGAVMISGAWRYQPTLEGAAIVWTVSMVLAGLSLLALPAVYRSTIDGYRVAVRIDRLRAYSRTLAEKG